ncbi:Concanavalin A-like lectin/glucanases superfamily protein [Mariniphaga anaerophila]|uniref:Concanavalin A-like lectin/glucanases superfamily protein n=1 Tax=Mariniphaga anaerophila TaxID=1484053 RepID=A0A1M5E8M3_9BACT|nr:LamG domain-containing protein [Mariniphaga anaerophila]SHF75613.1 Concanavalin A-like lectin/glucanases superfamily protein [Mariniphaga anaerophila]
MKTYSKLIILVLSILMFNACEEKFIDDISRVEPGVDETAPQIKVNFPPDGYELQTNEAVASITIDFEVRDDIEIADISVQIDDEEIASFNDFKDYRIAFKKITYDNVTTGLHTLKISANDLEGKNSVVNVNFTKAPPYVPKYGDEVFYMPFNNEYLEMNSLQLATKAGMPGFAEGIQHGTAYAGAADSYLSFPAAALQEATEVSATFWMKVGNTPDRAGVLVVAPPAENNNDRTKGFRFFRESTNGGTTQRFKLNIGTGSSDSWIDGGAAADVTPDTEEWTHFAFTISPTSAAVYINGELVKEGDIGGIDWTDCDQISIMSGAPNWTGWDHLSDNGLMDELRIFTKALTQDEIKTIMLKEQSSLYMNFNGKFRDELTGTEATVVGAPGFSYGGGVKGDAYQGKADSYLTFANPDVQNNEFSASFWLNINDVPDRAGILVMGPEDTENPEKQNNRKNGFRFFRESSNGGTTQRYKLNVGNGTADSWIDGGAAADVDPTTGDWVHFAFTITDDAAKVYIDGAMVKEGDISGIDWTGVDLLSIMSGAPRFNGWDHKSDESLMDELYIFKKALSEEEVNLMKADGLQ